MTWFPWFLFQMKCTGIPELTSTKDIDYLRNVLLLQKTEQEAEQHFIAQVQVVRVCDNRTYLRIPTGRDGL